MSKLKRNPGYVKEFADRFVELVEQELQLPYSEMWKRLGYTNHSTLVNVQKRKALLDPERMVVLAVMETAKGRTPNLHWLLTGKGPRTLGPSGTLQHKRQAEAGKKVSAVLQGLPNHKLEALNVLLSKR